MKNNKHDSPFTGAELCDGIIKEHTDDSISIEELRKVIRALPDTQKLIALLYCYDKLSIKKMALLLDISEKQSAEVLANVIGIICLNLHVPAVDIESISSAFSAEIDAQKIDPDSIRRIRDFILKNLKFQNS